MNGPRKPARSVERRRLTPQEWFDILLDSGPRPLLFDDIVFEPPAGPALAWGNRPVLAPESLVQTEGRLAGHRIVCAVIDFRFLGGNLGPAAAERLARGMRRGAQRHGIVLVTASGGWQAQQGVGALLRMPQVGAARAALRGAHKPLLVVCSDPSSGALAARMAASVAATADVILAEAAPHHGRGNTLERSGSPPRPAHRVARMAAPAANDARAADLVDEVVPRHELRMAVAGWLRALAGQAA